MSGGENRQVSLWKGGCSPSAGQSSGNALGKLGFGGVGGMSKKIPVCLPLGAKKLPFKDGS